MADDARVGRDAETREVRTRATRWQPASALPEPDKEAGFVYRWIRTAYRDRTDPSNVSAKLREGWEPVRVEEQPKFRLLVDKKSEFTDCIEVQGLLLCNATKKLMDQRKAYYAEQSKAQMEAVDNNFMRENDARMPLFKERKSTYSFGKGR